MRRLKRAAAMCLMVCLVLTGGLSFPELAFAKKAVTDKKIERLAKKEVKGGTIVELDRDYEKGVLIYEVQMQKGKKEYDLKYRASDAKLISYGWEIESYYIKRGSGKIISVNKCRKLAKKQVPNGKIISVAKKYNDGIVVYKVKAQKGNKKYKLEFHARTGKLLEFEWDLTIKRNSNSHKEYIGHERAKQIALKRTGGGHVVKAEFDMDDGIPVYEVEIMKDEFEYEIKVHALTGKILEFDVDSIYD